MAGQWPQAWPKPALTSLGFRAYQYDLSQRAGVYSFLEALKRDVPVIDIPVNNAGTILCKPAAEHPDAYWDTVIDTNLNAPFILTRELGRDMVARGSGKVIFTASLLTFQGGITLPGYAASKGAIGSLVKAFANEWAAKGVNVNAIAPGYITTDNTEALRDDAERSKGILFRLIAGEKPGISRASPSFWPRKPPATCMAPLSR